MSQAELVVDVAQFRNAHQAFLQRMYERSGGVPFTSFDHEVFVMDEVAYKYKALSQARAILQFAKWPTWIRKSGTIVKALKQACAPAVSNNLMEHRFGEQQASYCSLYRLNSIEQIASFEAQVITLLRAANERFGVCS